MPEANEPMQVMRCRVCDALLKAENVDFARGIASCGYCQAVMQFTSESAQASPTARAEVDLPDRFTVEDLGDEFRIIWRWFSLRVLVLVVFTVFWCGFLVFWYTIGIGSGSLIMLLFPLIHVAVGVGLAYTCLCMFLNTTKITVALGELSVVHGPLPWPGGGSYDAGDIEQLYCEHKIRHSDNNTTHRYLVRATMKGGKRQTLLKGLQEPNEALFIEQKLEEHLGIRDEAVAGEIPR